MMMSERSRIIPVQSSIIGIRSAGKIPIHFLRRLTRHCEFASMSRLVELFPILWLKPLHVLYVGLTSFDPAFDAAAKGQRLYLFVASLSNVICKPS
jgi:hypothetical protein